MGSTQLKHSTTHVGRRREREQEMREEMLDFPLSLEISNLYRKRAATKGAQERGVLVLFSP